MVPHHTVLNWNYKAMIRSDQLYSQAAHSSVVGSSGGGGSSDGGGATQVIGQNMSHGVCDIV